MIAYIALFSALLSRLTALACGSTWVTSFITRFLNIHRSGVLTALAWLVLHETAAVSAQVLCTPYNHAPCHFMQSHIRKVYACLAVTCHLHFWQNDRDLLRATAVTWGWNGYRNKSQHRKSTLDKKILPPLQQGFEPAAFQSRVRRSIHWAIPVFLFCALMAATNVVNVVHSFVADSSLWLGGVFFHLILQVGHRLRFLSCFVSFISVNCLLAWLGQPIFVCHQLLWFGRSFVWCQLFACLIRAAIFRLPPTFVVWSFFLCHRYLWTVLSQFFFFFFGHRHLCTVSFLHGLFCCRHSC